MPATVRMLVCTALVSTPAVAAAQVVDPWSQDAATPPASESAPTPPTPPSSAPAPAPVTQPTTAPPSDPPSRPGGLIDPWRVPSPTTLTMRRPGDWIAHPAPVVRPHRLRPAPPPVSAFVDRSSSPQRTYPLELAARPLVLPSGVTELRLSYERRAANVMVPNGLGGKTTTRVTSQTPDVNLAHSFSGAELGIGAGQFFYGWVAVQRERFPAHVQLSASISAPQNTSRYADWLSLSARHKLWTEGNEAALVGFAGVNAVAVNGVNVSGSRVQGEYLSSWLGLTLYVQAVSRFGMWFGAGGEHVLLESTDIGIETVWSASAGMLIAFDTWDIVVGGGLSTPSESAATSLSVGVRKRWGL